MDHTDRAALAVHTDNESLIICNGYKDTEFIRMALLGRKLGKTVILVVEKLEELAHILRVSKTMNVEPYVGLRVRLLSKGAGKWATSGGENAKFGLSTADLVEASEMLKAAGLGETTVGIVFLHDAVAQVAAGFPIVPVAPCEGTGYEIGSMSIIAGARNEAEAKQFYDWALSADVQSRAQTVNSFQLPSNKSATQSPLAPDLSQIKLIDYDFAKYGSSDERKRLLSKWDTEVSALPQ